MKQITPYLALGLGFALLVACGCGGVDSSTGSSPGSGAPPTSLLLVTIDTLRADRIGCYGYDPASTPTIDGLAGQGVRFEQACSTAPLTFPSHTSILTGTIPPFHGARDNASHRALPELTTLAEILQGAGFQTGAFTAAFVLDAIYGLDQGFDVYGDVPQMEGKPGSEFEERPASQVNAEAFAWLDTLSKDKPFFMWVHYFEPHLPYPGPDMLPAGFRTRPYDGEVHNADKALGNLIDYLDQVGRRDETLIVLTSDHGESFEEHEEDTHGYFAYEAVLRVPLIIQHSSLPAGLVIQERVSSINIMPTVLECFDISPGDVSSTVGGSVLALMKGEPHEPRPIYFESLGPLLSYGWAPIRGVTVDDMKYIRVPRPELYALESDPAELTNIHAENSELAKQLDGVLEEVLEDNFSAERAATAKRELTATERQKLANLGYTGTASDTTPELTLADPKDGVDRVHLEFEVRHHMDHEEYEEATLKLTKLIRADPKNPIFNAHFGLLLMKQMRHGEAIPYLRRSIKGGQDNASNHNNLGTCYEKVGQHEKARDSLLEALKQNPKHLLTLYWLGRAYTSLGEKDEARKCYEKVLELWDGGPGPIIQQMTELLEGLK